VATPPLHEAGAHVVPADQTAQAPAPLQKSVDPQEAWDVAVQAFRGSLPATALVQLPAAPGALHCWQPPAQALLQQTPSTQKPLAQVAFMAQVVPSGAAQTLPRQAPLEQSRLMVQVFPAEQGGQGPPQSTSVSVPFLTRSAQLGGWQVPEEQTPLTQSVPPWQVLPSGHGAQIPPPQSTAVSLPFFTPSAQLAAWQVPAEQTPLAQSEPETHWTQEPAPSHRTPPLEVHTEPAGLGDWPGTPATQRPTLQSLLADGRSPSSLAAARCPLPSHWFDLQSPGVGSLIFVPTGFGVSPHCPPAQVAAKQALEGTGQVVASVQIGAVAELVPPQPVSPRTSAATTAAERETDTEDSLLLVSQARAHPFEVERPGAVKCPRDGHTLEAWVSKKPPVNRPEHDPSLATSGVRSCIGGDTDGVGRISFVRTNLPEPTSTALPFAVAPLARPADPLAASLSARLRAADWCRAEGQGAARADAVAGRAAGALRG
jgi:hypothetical protein